jgi:hypothetical protein
MTTPLICLYCGKEFTRSNNYLNKLYKKNQKPKYCSMTCLNASKKKIREEKECLFCGSKFFVLPTRKVFCSRQCWWSYKSANAKADTRYLKAGLRFQVLTRDNFTCQYCGASPRKNSTTILHVDHIVPLSKGGTTTIDNLITSCELCNLGKFVSLVE